MQNSDSREIKPSRFAIDDRVISYYGHRFVISQKQHDDDGWSYEDGGGLWVSENYLLSDNWVSRLDIWVYERNNHLVNWISDQKEDIRLIGFLGIIVFTIAYIALTILWVIVKLLQIPGKLSE